MLSTSHLANCMEELNLLLGNAIYPVVKTGVGYVF
jgi:hypothetical protein